MITNKLLLFESLLQSSTRSLRTLGRLPRSANIPSLGLIPDQQSTKPIPIVPENEIDWHREMDVIRSNESRSVIAPANEVDPSTAYPLTRPSHNLAAFVKRSDTLQKLIHLGVDLHQIEKRKGLAQFVVKLDFEQNVQPHLQFLNDIGLSAASFGAFLTKNPLIIKENLADLTTRVNYLQSKLFTAENIVRIVEKNPFWLSFSTQRIDGRLGYFQKSFDLSGAQVRQLAVRQPKLITYGLDAVRQSSFTIREEFGFGETETKSLLLAAPKLWMMSKGFK